MASFLQDEYDRSYIPNKKGDETSMRISKRSMHLMLVFVLAIGILFPSQAFIPAAYAAEELNYALNKSVPGKSSDTSAGRATSAVDGNPSTYWQPLSSDRGDDLNVWMTVDLSDSQHINKTVLDFVGTHGLVNGYKILYSNTNGNWIEAYSRTRSTGAMAAKETAYFAEVTARYVRVSIDLTSNSLFKLGEFEVIGGGEPNAFPDLKRAYITDASSVEYAVDATIKLQKNASGIIKLHGELVNGEDADLTQAEFISSFSSSKPAVATVNSTGAISALKSGVTQITGTIRQGSITKATTIFIDVSDPEVLLADLQLSHPTMTTKVGQPAIVAPGDVYPTINVNPYVEAVLSGQVVNSVQQVVYELPTITLVPGASVQVPVPGSVSGIGEHQIRLTLTPSGKPMVYDTFYFFSADSGTIPAGQSKLAFIGANGKLVYAPDYKGNKVIDYSDAGYMGGGVELPDVPVKVTLFPAAEGDDTARIQEAINTVSSLPLSSDGFRGTVLLSNGTYRVGSKLVIRSSGVVLRGEGQGVDGTILYATGTEQRDILEIGGTRGPVLSTTMKTTVADMYVPMGASSFRVADASLFQVGDTIMVRRKGNDHWIHELLMDQITDRPGTSDSTQQWGPFDMNFDRIITKIEGNVITIDTPIANAIELQWGGGEVLPYTDVDRIEQVGVENMRVDVNFDPTNIKVDGGVSYFADDAHPETFIAMKSVKNAWVRDITGLHLGYALVYTGRDTKWTTTQDSTVLEMASTLDGGRRYPLLYEGQLGLTQRVNVDTARHSYIVGSRVPGPNVFLDGVAGVEFATSEPHHRWSVGGLFDNIDANIAIQDRGWLGSGHGWAGANWVAWNTKGRLALQGPPTSQNYAIGFTGTVSKPYLPNKDDLRPRNSGYWESLGTAVYPRSLYLKQLEDRLGSEAVTNIQKSSYGEPKLSSLELSDVQLNSTFDPKQLSYESSVTYNVYQTSVTAAAVDTGSKLFVNGVETATGQASEPIALNYGANTVQVAVYSPSGNASKTYSVVINRAQPLLTSISLTPKYMFVRSGETEATSVKGTYEDGSVKALTSGVAYSSSNASVAQVDASGVVTGVSPGVAKIVAEYGGQRAEGKAIVNGRPFQLVGIDLDSDKYSLKIGQTHTTVVQAVYSDRSEILVTSGVTYRSTNPTVAQVSANGIVTALKAGKADIIVEYNGEHEKAKVTVLEDAKPVTLTGIDVDDDSYSLRVGQTNTTKVYAEYSDRSRKQVTTGVTYRSSNPAVAKVDANGKVSSLKAGKADITVEFGGKQEKIKVTVTAAGGGLPHERDDD